MPTPRGWGVATVGAMLLLAGVVSQYRELALLGGAAVLAVGVAVLLVGQPGAVVARRSVGLTRTMPGHVVPVRLSAHNTGLRAVQLHERVADADGERTVALPSVKGRAQVESGYRLGAARRGVVELGPLWAGRADPLGLASLLRRNGGTDRIWVHPRWVYLRAIPSGRVNDPDGLVDGGRAGALTFHTLRDYVPGDDLRHVHWRSSARQDKLVVREYIDTSRTRVRVLVDDRPNDGGGPRLDEVAGAAASVMATGIRASLHCELQLVRGPSRDSTSGLPPLLDLLAEARPDPTADLDRALRLARTLPAGDTMVLVSGGLTGDDLRMFAQLRARYSGLFGVVLGGGAPPAAPSGVTLLAAPDADAFAHRWNEAPWSR
jgi:uncharacterized protein (DUF58 family)